MREVFTKNAFTRGYTGSRGTKVTPGWREGTYDVEYNNSADAADALLAFGLHYCTYSCNNGG